MTARSKLRQQADVALVTFLIRVSAILLGAIVLHEALSAATSLVTRRREATCLYESAIALRT